MTTRLLGLFVGFTVVWIVGRDLVANGYTVGWLVTIVLLVLLGPWALMVFFVGPTELARTLRDGLRPKGGAGQSQERSATVLRRTEGLTFATGFVVALLAMHAGLYEVAVRGDQATVLDLQSFLGRMLVPVLFAVVLRFLIYEPLATALEHEGDDDT